MPQLLVVWAPFAPFAALSFVVMVVLWASFGWIIGLSVILVVYALVLCSPLGAMEMEELKDEALRSDEHMSIYLGAEVVEAKGPKEKRPLVIMGTKLVLENLLQLWLQSSYLSLSFDRMDNDARWQAMASIGVGLLVAGRFHNGPVSTHRLQSSSFLWFIFRILEGNPEKELLWSLWEYYSSLSNQ